MRASKPNFSEASTKSLITLVQNIRSGFDKMAAMGDEAFRGDPEHKVAPAAQMSPVMVSLLADAEARLHERGVDPKQVPGNDWLTEFLTVFTEI